MAKLVYDPKTKKMVPQAEIKAAKAEAGYERISLDGTLFSALKNVAIEDGVTFAGTSKITLKNADGTIKKDKDGNTLYEQETVQVDGKPVKQDKVIQVAESKAKVSNTVRTYVEIAVKEWLAARAEAANQ